MKIVFLTRLFYPHVGGVEKHVFEITRLLIHKGHEVSIITEELRPPDRQELPTDIEKELKSLTVYHIPIKKHDWFNKFRIWKWMWKNREIFLNSDVIHCHDVFFWYLPFALLFPFKNVYTTFHGYEGYPIKKKAIIYRKIFEFISNKTICVGDFMRKWYHANPTDVIYGGVHNSKSTQMPKKNSAIFIGRLDDQTGIDTYVKATSIIRKQVSDFMLTVYGDGPLKTYVKGEGIILKGFDVSADQQLPKYELAFVSRYLSILEALMSKRLVIAAFDNPVKEDYLRMTPYADSITISNDPSEIAGQVVRLLKNKKEQQALIEKGYKYARGYTWEAVVDAYLTLWKRNASSSSKE